MCALTTAKLVESDGAAHMLLACCSKRVRKAKRSLRSPEAHTPQLWPAAIWSAPCASAVAWCPSRKPRAHVGKETPMSQRRGGAMLGRLPERAPAPQPRTGHAPERFRQRDDCRDMHRMGHGVGVARANRAVAEALPARVSGVAWVAWVHHTPPRVAERRNPWCWRTVQSVEAAAAVWASVARVGGDLWRVPSANGLVRSCRMPLRTVIRGEHCDACVDGCCEHSSPCSILPRHRP